MGFLNVNNTVILHSAVFVFDLEFMNSWMFMMFIMNIQAALEMGCSSIML